MKVFPIAGWNKLARTPKPQDPTKLCSAFSYVDDYNDKRGDFIHGATDIFTNIGTPVLAVTDGVMWANTDLGDRRDSYTYWKDGGYHAYLWGDDGFIYYYAHLLNMPLVRPGQRVSAGQLIGYADRSGNVATCCHVHFAMYRISGGKKGAAVNPYPYLKIVEPTANPNYAVAAGIGLGTLAILGIGGFLLWRYLRRRRNR